MVDLNEYNAGDLLRAGLSPEPPRPPRVDIAAAVRAGRRRRSARRAAVVGGVAVAVAVVVAVPAALALNRNEGAPAGPDPTSPATFHTVNPNTGSPGPQPSRSLGGLPFVSPPTSCTVHELPAPAGGGSNLVTAGSPDGQVHFGQLYLTGGDKRVVRWRAGQPATVTVEGDEPMVRSVNNYHDAVGNSLVDGRWVPWLLRDDDTVTRLPGDGDLYAGAISDTGAVAGSRGSDGPGGHPIVWRDTAAAPVELALPAGATGGQVRAIDEQGAVFGSVTMGSQELPYYWAANGTGKQLPLPPGTPTAPNSGGRPGPSTVVYSARGGWATGVAGLYSSSPKPVRWSVRGDLVVVLSGVDAPAGPVNGMGFVVGGTTGGRAVLLADDQRLVLPAILDPTKDRPNLARTISDDGRTIAGQAWKTGDTFQAVVWNCH
ncbi:hypothetical protein [Dactylosporangium sp. NPDC049140]|uniref:hypothetical protein n=1 Tax=Dactylosporangium sp. NPDC049140 TaxID=3155647 RepID=UPI0033EF1BAA